MTNQIDKGPVGATHRYEHGSDVDWYCYTDRGLYRWFQGSWCASVHKTIKELANSCPLGRLEAIPAEPAQPFEDHLTWLARNVHQWAAGATHVAKNSHGHLWAKDPKPAEAWFTRDQWLARRAELQNRPSWKDAPERATALAQDSALEDGLGAWWWYEFSPTECEWIWSSQGRSYAAKERGEVLGDWRDTLEKRPADLSEPAVTKRPDEATQIVRAAVPELVKEKYRFELGDFDNQELATMHSDSDDWFAGVDLPPVGMTCEQADDVGGFLKVEIIAVHAGYAFGWAGDRGMVYFSDKAHEFRPIQTDHDRLTDILIKHGIKAHVSKAAEAILAAGFKRDGGA